MESCQGSIKQLIKNNIMKFDERMARNILRDICRAQKHIHTKKIVHLDIKPDNILYSHTKKFKLGDLGLSRLAYRTKEEDIVEGDSRYMPLELLKDVEDESQLPDLTKADIFSLGASIYEFIINELYILLSILSCF